MFFYGKVLATFLCIPMHEISLSVKVLTWLLLSEVCLLLFQIYSLLSKFLMSHVSTDMEHIIILLKTNFDSDYIVHLIDTVSRPSLWTVSSSMELLSVSDARDNFPKSEIYWNICSVYVLYIGHCKRNWVDDIRL